MKKVLAIGWKDVVVTFRDQAALILMLAAPFVLILGMGLVTGRFSGGGNAGLSNIPVVIVNQDEGALGAALVEVFTSEDLSKLVKPTTISDVAEARRQVEGGNVAAAVIIPAGFSAGVLPDPRTGQGGAAVPIEVYSDPGRPINAGVVQSIVDRFVTQIETGRIGAQVAITQLITSGRIKPQDATRIGQEIGARVASQQDSSQLIALRRENATAAPTPQVDLMAYLAPGMALVFLMYTVTHGGRSILSERHGGTLPRLLTTPTSAAQVLGGKVLGVFLTGVSQMGILILAGSLLFRLKWGDPFGVIALVLAVVAGATGWGILLASIAKTPGQVSSVGTALMLAFSVLGGNFVGGVNLPGGLQVVGWITPNYWGQQGFNLLGSGGRLANLVTPIGATLAMSAVLFVVAVMFFRRNGIAQR